MTEKQEVLIHVRRGDEFLCTHRAPDGGGYWHVIAGGVEPGEEFHAAAVRELREETGLEVERLERIGEFAYTREEWESEPGLRAHVECFLADVPAGWEPALDREHDDYRWLPRDDAAQLLFWPEPAQLLRALASRASDELWHVSEDPTIEVFVPHRAPTSSLDEPFVWAIDTDRQWLYWFPRDCPRATWCASGRTSEEDVARWLDGDRDRRVAVIETGWLDRMRTARLYAYRLAPDTFEPWDKFYVSRETVVPLEIVELGDLLARHAEAGTELRIAPSLYPLWDRVIDTTLDFSGIRLRNAVRA